MQPTDLIQRERRERPEESREVGSDGAGARDGLKGSHAIIPQAPVRNLLYARHSGERTRELDWHRLANSEHRPQVKDAGKVHPFYSHRKKNYE